MVPARLRGILQGGHRGYRRCAPERPSRIRQSIGDNPDAVGRAIYLPETIAYLDLHIYYGTIPGSFLYYEDDGNTYAYEKDTFYKRTITFDPVKKSISLSKVEGSFASRFSAIRLVLHSFGDVMTLKSEGKDFSLKLKSSMERTVEIPLTNSEMKLTY